MRVFWSLGKPGHLVSVSAYSWAMTGQEWSITSPYSGQHIASCLMLHYRSERSRSIEFSIWSFQGKRLKRTTKKLSSKYLTWQPFRLIPTSAMFYKEPVMVITRSLNSNWFYLGLILFITLTSKERQDISLLFRLTSNKHQSCASLTPLWGKFHQWPVDFPHKGPIIQKAFPWSLSHGRPRSQRPFWNVGTVWSILCHSKSLLSKEIWTKTCHFLSTKTDSQCFYSIFPGNLSLWIIKISQGWLAFFA